MAMECVALNRLFGWITLRTLRISATAVILLFGFIASALSEPQRKRPAVVPPAASTLPPSYTAKTVLQVKKQGIIEAAGTKWSCRMSLCTATAPFPPITVASCKAIQSQVGNIAAFGDGKRFLTASEIRGCIGVVGAPPRTSPGLSIGTAALSPAVAKQLSNRIEGFRKAQEALARQRREAVARVPTAPGSRGYFSAGNDCDDSSASVHPGATEVCNLIDDNCNGEVDERVVANFYLDADGDLHGNPLRALAACPHQIGTIAEGAYLVPLGNDCDDTNPDRWHDC
jgi:hypothetical protein